MARFALALKIDKHLTWPRFVRWIAGPDNRIIIHFGISTEDFQDAHEID